MKLDLIRHDEKFTSKGTSTLDVYRAGRYIVRRIFSQYNDGHTWERISADKDFDAEFLPTIEYDGDEWSENPKPCFKIQTMAYGAMTPDKIQKVIAGYQEALEVVELLTKKFVK